MKERIKEHLAEKKHHYKVALIGVLLLAIFLFAHTVGDTSPKEGISKEEFSRCWSNRDCSADQFCDFDICLAETGKCVDVPQVCPNLWNPVCGCDGKTYPNDCARRVSKVSKEHDGAC